MKNAKQFVIPSFKVHKNISSTPVTNEDSSNWSGYEVRDPTFQMNYVYGQWSVPDINNSDRTSYSVTWDGLDGDAYGKKHLIQAGTAQFKVNGVNQYYFWYEQITPHHDTNMIELTGPDISPSQDVEVYIQYNSTYQSVDYFIKNTTTGKYTSWTTSALYNGYTAWYGNTAEWIEERPTVNGTLPYLADFRIVNFFNCSAQSYSNVYGGSIGGGTWSYVRKIKMTTNGLESGTVLATPTSLINNGKFAVNWNAYP